MRRIQHVLGQSNGLGRAAVALLLTSAAASVADAQGQPTKASGANARVAPIHSMVIPGDSARSMRPATHGRVRSLLDTATITLQRLEGHVTTLAPGAEPHAAHRHAHEEVLLVERGTLDVLQGGVKRRAGPGSLIFQASNELHGLRNVGPDTASYWVLAFYPKDLAPDAAPPRP